MNIRSNLRIDIWKLGNAMGGWIVEEKTESAVEVIYSKAKLKNCTGIYEGL